MKHNTTDRKFGHHIAALALGIALAAATSALHANPVTENGPALNGHDAAKYAYAVQLFGERRYAAAYGRFADLADAGNAQSAQMALTMLINGQDLFDGHWSASIGQQQKWIQLVQTALQGNLALKLSQAGD